MGMFDYVLLPFKCPECSYSENHHEWQTKALNNCLFKYGPGYRISASTAEVDAGAIEIHTICPNCDKLIDAKATITKSRITGNIVYSMIRLSDDNRIRRQARQHVRQMTISLKGLKKLNLKLHSRSTKNKN